MGGYPYLLPDGIEGLFGDRIRDISYTAAMGMPSPVMLMPYAPAMLPASWVRGMPRVVARRQQGRH